MKRGLIDVGGGFRDIFGAGVMDRLLDEKIGFEYCIGISAGSANMTSYLAGQRGRNYTFYMNYAFRKEYASVQNYIRTGNYVGLDYAYGTLSNSGGEYPLDYDAMMANPAKFLIVACDARTGAAVYMDSRIMKRDHYDALMASSSLPVVGPPRMIGKIPCYDGGLSDPVPVRKAFEDGCGKAVLILTRPVDQPRVQKKDLFSAKLLERRWPRAAKRLRMRYKTYNDSVELAKQYEREGKLLIIAPDDLCGMTTLRRDRKSMQQMYDKGYENAGKIRAFLET